MHGVGHREALDAVEGCHTWSYVKAREQGDGHELAVAMTKLGWWRQSRVGQWWLKFRCGKVTVR
jgi:hypothetical protein